MVDLTAKPVSELGAASSLSTSDEIIVRQGANAKRANSSVLTAYMANDIGAEVSSQIKPGRTFDTRADFITHRGGSKWGQDPNGTVYRVNGVEYVKATGSTDISDIADVTVSGDVGYPEHWGITRNSTGFGNGTDWTSKFQEAVDWCEGAKGRKIQVQAGTNGIRFGSGLTRTGTINIDWGDCDYYLDGDFRLFDDTPTGDIYALTANYTKGSKALTVASTGTALAPGTWIKIVSNAVAPYNRDEGSNTNKYRVAEWLQVGVGSTTTNVVLQDAVRYPRGINPTSGAGDEARVDAYQTGATYNARIVVPDWSDVTMKGGRFHYEDGNEATFSGPLVSFAAVRNLTIDGLEQSRGYGPGVRHSGCIFVRLSNLNIRNLENDTSNGQFGYGTTAQGSFSTHVTHCYFENGRHAFTTNNSPIAADSTDIRGLISSGITQGGFIAFNEAVDYRSEAPFDSHHDSEGFTFLANRAIRCNSYACTIRGRGHVVSHMVGRQVRGGINIFTDYSSGDPDDDLWLNGILAEDYSSATILFPDIEITQASALPVIHSNAATIDVTFGVPCKSVAPYFLELKGPCRLSGTAVFEHVDFDGAYTLQEPANAAGIKIEGQDAKLTGVLGESLVIETGADVRYVADGMQDSTFVCVDAAAGTTLGIRGKLYFRVDPAISSILSGSGTVTTSDNGLIEYFVTGGGDDSAVDAGETGRDVSIVAADGTFRYGGMQVLEFSSRTAAINALSNMYEGQRFKVGDLEFRKVASSSVIPDMSNVEPASAFVADFRHFEASTSQTDKNAGAQAAVNWKNAGDFRSLVATDDIWLTGPLPAFTAEGGFVDTSRADIIVRAAATSGSVFLLGTTGTKLNRCRFDIGTMRHQGTANVDDFAIDFVNTSGVVFRVDAVLNFASLLRVGSSTTNAQQSEFGFMQAILSKGGSAESNVLFQNLSNFDYYGGAINSGGVACNGNANGAIMRVRGVSGQGIDTLRLIGFSCQMFSVGADGDHTPGSIAVDGKPYGLVIDGRNDRMPINLEVSGYCVLDHTTTVGLHIVDDANTENNSRYNNISNIHIVNDSGVCVKLEKGSPSTIKWNYTLTDLNLGGSDTSNLVEISGDGYNACSLTGCVITNTNQSATAAAAIDIASDGWLISDNKIGAFAASSAIGVGINVSDADITELTVQGNMIAADIATPISIPTFTTAAASAPARVIHDAGNPMENLAVEGLLTATGGISAGGSSLINSDGEVVELTLDRTGLTISSGSVTPTRMFHAIDTESAAATDDLDTIANPTLGRLLFIHPANDARTVVAKDGTGNLRLAGDFSMDSALDVLGLVGLGSVWAEITRSDNAT